ncbi:MAG: AmmeMemoRadiSam system protein B [Candidatus Shapirobacteria bacterium]
MQKRLKKTKILLLRLLSVSFCLLIGGIIWSIGFGDIKNNKAEIKAAIVTHHLVAEEMMMDLGNRLAKNTNIPRVILIGPNHDEVGGGHLLTNDIDLYSNGKLITFDKILTNKDHACYAPESVLKKYLPKTIISCVLVSSRTTPKEIDELVLELKNLLGKDGVLVASVDFSHYLPIQQASQNDTLTWEDIKSQNTVSLLKKGNHFLDSPKTMAILFAYLKLRNIVNMLPIKHLNSAQILNIPDSPSTTSYFEVVYW